MGTALDNWKAAPYTDDEQDAEEAREERIGERAGEVAKRLIVDEAFCGNALNDMYQHGDVEHMLNAVGTFAARFEAEPSGTTTDTSLAEIGYQLWKALRPYIAHAAKDQSEDDARTEIDAEDQSNRNDAAEHAADARCAA